MIVCALTTIAACGQTNRQAVDELRSEFAPLLPKLASLQKLVDAAPLRSGALSGFEFSDLDEAKASASFMRYDELAEPVPAAVDTRAGYLKPFDLYASGSFGLCLRRVLAAPKPGGEAALGMRNGKALLAQCRPALGLRYLVVVKTARYAPPRKLTQGSFAGGDATLEVAVVDWQRAEVVSKFAVEGVPDQVVRYATKRPNGDSGSAEESFYGTMWADAKRAITAQLVARGARITWR